MVVIDDGVGAMVEVDESCGCRSWLELLLIRRSGRWACVGCCWSRGCDGWLFVDDGLVVVLPGDGVLCGRVYGAQSCEFYEDGS